MASYSIVLNLGGNINERLSKVNRQLDVADKRAKSLHKSLLGLNAMSKGINLKGIDSLMRKLAEADKHAKSLSKSLGLASVRGAVNTAGSGSASSLYRRERDVNYTRHRATRIASWGTGFSIGGFTGRLSTIIQPDINGKILGMNAESLMKGVNVAAIAGNIVWSVGKALAKTSLWSTGISFGMGAGVNAMFTKLLMSEGMSQGVRMIQRRNQARLGLGSSYLEAQGYADMLARDYGLERSASIASLNVLSGLRIGNTNRKLTLNDATALTRVGGLISQQAGVSFERVMTNIQQLMTQSNPNIRDIRELLNQAPILGRYALDEMEKKGITGVDKNTYLKDQSNLLSVLQRYDLENMSSTVTQARGMVTLAQQDFYTKLAENPSWLTVAGNVSDLMGALAEAISNLLTAFTSNTDFRNSINSLTFLVESIGNNAGAIIDWTGKAGRHLADLFGLDPLEEEKKARKYTQQQETILHYGKLRSDEVFAQWLAAGGSKSSDPDIQRKQFNEWWNKELETATRRGSSLLGKVQFLGEASHAPSWTDYAMSTVSDIFSGDFSLTPGKYVSPTSAAFYNNELRKRYSGFGFPYDNAYRPRGSFGEYESRPSFYAYASKIDPADFDAFVSSAIAEATKSPDLGIPAATPMGYGAVTGSDLSGFNRDKRNLEIHFHAPIVEWDSTINTDDPQAVVDEVSETIESAASRAIQIALLGASNKMTSRWY